MRSVALAIFVTVIAILGVAFAQNAPKPKPVASTQDTVQTTAASPQQNEAVLRAQMQVMKDYDQRITATVFWALGAVVGIAVLLTGFSWYTNFRLFEKEKDAIARQLEAGLSKRIEEIEGRVREHGERSLKSLVTSVDARFDAYSSALEAKTSTLTATAKALHQEVRSNHLEVQYQLADSEAKQWESTKVWTNAIRTRLTAARHAKTLASSYRLGRCLDKLKETLTGERLTALKLDSADISTVVVFIDGLGPEHSVTAEAIKDALRKL